MKNNVKYSLKEISQWFKRLEEKRYRKRYAVDTKRIHHFANNGPTSELPMSLQKKTEGITYNRERQLARQFVKHIKEQIKLAKEQEKYKIKQENKMTSKLNKLIKEELEKLL
jgi:ribosomal protein S16